MDWRHCRSTRLFPQGHDIVAPTATFCAGTGAAGDTTLAVIGTTRPRARSASSIALAMARAVLATRARSIPARPILFLVDTQGQRLRRRDELLGINRYMAHLAQVRRARARAAGHRVLGARLRPGAVGRLPRERPDGRRLRCAARRRDPRDAPPGDGARDAAAARSGCARSPLSSPVFAPGRDQLRAHGRDRRAVGRRSGAACLLDALAAGDRRDCRAERGQARGGRLRAFPVAQRIADEA